MKIMACQKYTNNSGQKNVARSVAVVAVRLWGVQRIWFSLPAAVQIRRSGGEALFCPGPSAGAPISAAGMILTCQRCYVSCGNNTLSQP